MTRILVFLLALAPLAASGEPPVSHRDPFRPPPLLDPPTRGQWLPEWSVGDLRLTAIVDGNGQRFALVEPPKGPGLLLQMGSSFGREGAIVQSIGGDRVVAWEERRTVTTTLVVEHLLRLERPEPLVAAPGP